MESNRVTDYRALYDDDDLQTDDFTGGITLNLDTELHLQNPYPSRPGGEEDLRHSAREASSNATPRNTSFIHYGDLVPEALRDNSRTRVSRNLLPELIEIGKNASPRKLVSASGGVLLHDHVPVGRDTSRDADTHSEAGSAGSDDSSVTVTPARANSTLRDDPQIITPSNLHATVPTLVPSPLQTCVVQTDEESKQPLKHLRSASDRLDSSSVAAAPHLKSLSSGDCKS